VLIDSQNIFELHVTCQQIGGDKASLDPYVRIVFCTLSAFGKPFLKWCIDLRIFCAEAIQFLKSVDFLLIAARSLRRRDRQSFIGYGKGSDFGGGDLDQSPSLWAVLMAYEALCFGADGCHE